MTMSIWNWLLGDKAETKAPAKKKAVKVTGKEKKKVVKKKKKVAKKKKK